MFAALRFCAVAACLLFVLTALQNTAADETPPPLAPLHVHLVAHSHCDPGWLKTFEEYQLVVDLILSEVTACLQDNASRKFSWAEISFFSQWWEKQTAGTKESWRSWVKEGRIEFIEGGWVQNDEAGATLEDVVHQLSVGHDYLEREFGVRPRVAWQIDPFGHSSLSPTVYARVGFEVVVLNRINFAVKNILKEQAALEFQWSPSETLRERGEIFAHMLHSHYGPMDGFRFESGSGWPITDDTVSERATTFLRECRHRQQAYRTNHLMMLQGEDFTFQNAKAHFVPMDLLIRHINNNSDTYNATVQWSTPSDYFAAVARAAAEPDARRFPVYHGDFFPYADNPNSFWSGYYTSRPMHKGASRRSDAALRAAEVSYVLAATRPVPLMPRATANLNASAANFSEPTPLVDLHNLVTARRMTALFMHHDAITGTSRSLVMEDYLRKLLTAERNAEAVVATAHAVLLARDGVSPPRFQPLPHDHEETGIDKLQPLTPLRPAQRLPVVVFNSLAWRRSEVVVVRVVSRDTCVQDGDGRPVPAQLLLDMEPLPDLERRTRSWLFKEPPNTSDEWFRLAFVVDMEPLASRTLFLVSCSGAAAPRPTLSALAIHTQVVGVPEELRGDANVSTVVLRNGVVEVTLTAAGTIDTIKAAAAAATAKTSARITVRQGFAVYLSDRSGAYRFAPQGEAKLHFESDDDVRQLVAVVQRGPIVEEATMYYAISTQYDQSLRVQQRVAVVRTGSERDAAVETTIESEVPRGVELVQRFDTDLMNPLDNGDDDYEDGDGDGDDDGGGGGGDSSADTGVGDSSSRDFDVFYTDNGAELVRRERERSSDTVGAGYYPCLTTLLVRSPRRSEAAAEAAAAKPDPATGAPTPTDEQLQFTVLTQQVHGASSRAPGSVELMLHRRFSADDGFGLNEALDDAARPSEHFVLLAQHAIVAEDSRRRLSLMANHPLQLLVGESFVGSAADYRQQYHIEVRPLQDPLPPSVHLFSLEMQNDTRAASAQGVVVARLLHTMEQHQSERHSTVMEIDLRQVVASAVSATERTLTLVAPIDTVLSTHRWQFPVDRGELLSGAGSFSSPRTRTAAALASAPAVAASGSSLAVQLHPMDLRAFQVRFDLDAASAASWQAVSEQQPKGDSLKSLALVPLMLLFVLLVLAARRVFRAPSPSVWQDVESRREVDGDHAKAH